MSNLRDSLQAWVEDNPDTRIVGILLLVMLLAVGGFFTARALAGESKAVVDSTKSLVKITTAVKEPVTVRVHGHAVVRYRIKKRVIYAKPETVMETQTIHTPHGTKVVTKRVVHYKPVYKTKVVTKNGKTTTLTRPVTSTDIQTVTNVKVVNNTTTITVVNTVTNVVTTTIIQTITVPVTTTETTTVTEPVTT